MQGSYSTFKYQLYGAEVLRKILDLLHGLLSALPWALPMVMVGKGLQLVAQLFERQANWFIASRLYAKALTFDPTNAVLYRDWGASLVQQTDWAAAEKAYQQAITLNPSPSWEWNHWGDCLVAQEKWREATEAYQQATLALPDFFWAHYKLGNVLSRLQRWSQATAAYQKALVCDPNHADTYHRLGDVLGHQACWEAAVQAYKSAIAIQPDFFWSHNNLGDALMALEQWEQAATAYHQALTLQSDTDQIAEKRSWALHCAVAHQPRVCDRYLDLAHSLLDQGKKTEAIATYQMALQVEPTHLEILLALADLLESTHPTQAETYRTRAQKASNPASTQLAIPNLRDIPSLEALIEATQLFDADYYRKANPDLTGDDSALLRHYLTIGAAQGRDPNPLFSSSYYWQQYPDIAYQSINPLAHYCTFGYREGRNPHPLFNWPTFSMQAHKRATSPFAPSSCPGSNNPPQPRPLTCVA
jgi:tetratricopeptide (TPR) repeat protein